MRGHEHAVRLELELGTGGQERLAPALGMEADDVVRQQPVVDRVHDRGRQDRPRLGITHGMCVKCAIATPGWRSRTTRGARYRW